jgi:hypothetical protein
MELAVPFVVVILTAMVMLVSAIYLGGGMDAIRRQVGTLVAITVVLAALGLVIFVIAGLNAGLAVLTPGVAAASAVIAGLQARWISSRRTTPSLPKLAIVLWVIAGFFALLAPASAVLLLT